MKCLYCGKEFDFEKRQAKQKEAKEQIEEYSEFEEIKNIKNLKKFTVVAVNDDIYVEEV